MQLNGWLARLRTRFGSRSMGGDRLEFAARILRCADAAAAVMEETDPDFVRLANDLNDLYTCATELGSSTDRQIASLRDAIAQTRLSGADSVAGVLLGGLRAAIGETQAELKSLREICTELRQLIQLGDRIELTAVFLNTARYSFRVESARTEATRQSFGAFSEELEPLAGQVRGVGDAISRGARSADAELQGLIRAIGSDSDQLRTVASDTGRVVEETCLEGQHLLDSSFAALQDSANRARQRTHYADEAVYHVQFGDIIRQKVQHISAALRDGAENLTNSAAVAAQADHVLAIQQGQIERIASEIQSVRQALPRAFAGLGEETEALAASLRKLGEGRGSDIFDELTTRLGQMEELESRGRSMRERSRMSWNRALETAREGSRHMDDLREINFRMHLQSLNAIIKTEWLGEQGVTLGVLSSHMHTLFCESSTLVADAAAVLGSLAGKTAGSHADASEGDLKAGLDRGLLAMSRLRQEFSRTIAAAEDLAQRQISQLDQARKSIGFLDTLSERILTLAEQIRGLRSDITPLLADAAAARDPLSLERHYTMESEREVHRRHIGESGSERPGASEAAETRQVDESPDNVEFF